MSASDWFWVGWHNAIDRRKCGIRFDVGARKVAAYWVGAVLGKLARFIDGPIKL